MARTRTEVLWKLFVKTIILVFMVAPFKQRFAPPRRRSSQRCSPPKASICHHIETPVTRSTRATAAAFPLNQSGDLSRWTDQRRTVQSRRRCSGVMRS